MSISIEGLDKLYKKFDRVKATSTLVPPTQRAVLRIQRRMQKYPPQRPGSKYDRKGTLGKRWTVRVKRTGDAVQGKVGNATVYAPFVQSHQFQRRIHRGRWQTDQRVVREEERVIVADFKRTVDKALEG